MKNIINYIHEAFNSELNNIPEECGIDKPKCYDKDVPFKFFEYFGDCRNTEKVWDANQMSGFINTCSVITDQSEILRIISKMVGGDRKLPKKLTNHIDKLKQKNELFNLEEIVFGINDYQRILFVYISAFDIHFFFDCSNKSW